MLMKQAKMKSKKKVNDENGDKNKKKAE